MESNDGLLEALLFTAEQQIRDQTPPEVRQTLVRLRRAGYDCGVIMSMIATSCFMKPRVRTAREENPIFHAMSLNFSGYRRWIARGAHPE
jgi:hypothetical protein